jgi:hypothetical protein
MLCELRHHTQGHIAFVVNDVPTTPRVIVYKGRGFIYGYTHTVKAPAGEGGTRQEAVFMEATTFFVPKIGEGIGLAEAG